MQMDTFSQLKNTILKFGLAPSTSREMPLFSFSCVAFGYTKLLRERLGFSYEATAAFGENGVWRSLFNERLVAERMERFLKEHKDFEKAALLPADTLFKKLEAEFLQADEFEPRQRLTSICDMYPKYMSCIGVYNCFWRYLGNDEQKSVLTESDINRISVGRELLAKFYPKVEKAINDCVNGIGGKEGFERDLLRYFSLSEMGKFLDGHLSITDTENTLRLRREKYFYMYVEEGTREEIVTNKPVIEKLWNEFYEVPAEPQIKGFSVCKGVVRGEVYNRQISSSRRAVPKEGFILVASMTRPDDLELIKSCAAIVTDEGGILSHAAVIARELQKPCIIGTKHASRILKDGITVEVNADTGNVKIL